MRDQQLMQLRLLDEKLKAFRPARDSEVPWKGWLHAIRSSLKMTLKQVAEKMKVSPPAIKKLEDSEQRGAITINSMRSYADAMGMDFVYGFVPREASLEDKLRQRAREVAESIVKRTHQNMLLEDQAIADNELKKAVDELSEKLFLDFKSGLWA